MKQGSLFALRAREVDAARVDLGDAAKVSERVRLGTMSWAYRGWAGIVYGDRVALKDMSELGLTAYSKHPLLRAVEVDRSYYEPLSAETFEAYAGQVPDDFRFVVKAHEECTVRVFPTHARYGPKRGLANDRYFDVAYAAEHVVGPTAAGLGPKLGALLFQFPPQDVGEDVHSFADRVHAFLSRLPKGVRYAVELRKCRIAHASICRGACGRWRGALSQHLVIDAIGACAGEVHSTFGEEATSHPMASARRGLVRGGGVAVRSV